MASTEEPQQAKPSFAKVAATSYNLLRQSTSAQTNGQVVDDTAKDDPMTRVSQALAEPGFSRDLKGKATPVAGGPVSNAPRRVDALIGGARRDKPVQPSTYGDSHTQLSSNVSLNQTSLDGKSVTSGSGTGTTCVLDEKESLRPDDSASTRALDEEDLSAPGSVGPESRIGSDSGIRNFHDQLQLREMDVAAAPPRLEILPRTPSSHDALRQASNIGPQTQSEVEALHRSTTSPTFGDSAMDLDSKLREAMDSPKDRIFVLKLEQDIVDFLKDPQEFELHLPQCNAFYRLLAHRLADYYGLGHQANSPSSAAFVRLFKKPETRMPTPLSELLGLYKQAKDTEPPAPLRKIMRREDSKPNSRPGTAHTSEAPSKATSEAGDAINSDAGQAAEPKTKANMTREEREAKYKEARERIFGSEQNDKEDGQSTDNRLMSRSSSAAGKSKSRNTRHTHDDDFEARSQYAARINQSHGMVPNNSDGSGMTYVMAPTPGMTLGYSPTNATFPAYPSSFSGMYAQADAQGNFIYGSSGGVPVQSYQFAPSYNLPAEFNRAMQTFRNADAPAQAEPALPGVGAYNEMTSPFATHRWPPAGYTMQSTGQVPLVQSQYSYVPIGQPYGSFAPQVQSAYGQHSVPGNFRRAQFNPNSQAFVPGHHVGQGQNSSASPHLGSVGSFPTAIPMAHRTLPAQASGFTIPNTQAPSNGSARPTPGAPQTYGQQRPNAAANQSATSAGSSLAKWGTPAHLPPKPPPPASHVPQRVLDNQRNMHPPVFSTPPRHPGNPPMQATTTAGAVPGASSK